MHRKKIKEMARKNRIRTGQFGSLSFYGALSTYFIVFVTSGMFDGVEKASPTN